MQFSKSPGSRVTDIRMESGFNVIRLNPAMETHIFKIKPLFPDQFFSIKNCSMEIEIFK